MLEHRSNSERNDNLTITGELGVRPWKGLERSSQVYIISQGKRMVHAHPKQEVIRLHFGLLVSLLSFFMSAACSLITEQ